MIRTQTTRFEPAVLSMPELTFLLDHLTEAPHVALHKGTPPGVNPVEIRRHLTQLQELDQLQQAHGVAWAGFEAVKDSILRYLAWSERTEEIYRRTGGDVSRSSIRHASLFAWDEHGNAYKAGIDADAGEMVRTEILDDGTRKPFGVNLLEPEGHVIPQLDEVAPWVRKSRSEIAKVVDTISDTQKGRHGSLTCSICGKAEAYDVKSRQTFTMARTRMSKHLKGAKTDVARHRLLYRKIYESPTRAATATS
jgi:hypothetical protein